LLPRSEREIAKKIRFATDFHETLKMQRDTINIAHSHRAMTDDDQDVSDDLVVVVDIV
jgi:hypothetical protein